MRYGSVCSGIEAATVAWHPLGWDAAWFAEIDPFASAVLAERWPGVRNLGDFTAIEAEPGSIDLLVGGTPCQSFSVAGKRLGLDDPRGNLAIEFLRLASRARPRWLVWENVPGVLSSGGGRDFGAFLGLLGELGYGWAYRVLDAQHFGVPQRRRRVFVVGHLGDWRRAVAVLFERHSLSGHPAPGREAESGVAPSVTPGARRASGNRGGELLNVAGCLNSRGNNGGFRTEPGEHLVASSGAVARPLTSHPGGNRSDLDTETFVAHTLRGEGFDASEDGTGRGTPLIPVPFDATQITSDKNYSNPKPGDPCHPLAAGGHPPAIAFQERGRDSGRTLEWQEDTAYSLNAPSGGGRRHELNVCVPTAFTELGEGHVTYQETDVATSLRSDGGGAKAANLIAFNGTASKPSPGLSTPTLRGGSHENAGHVACVADFRNMATGDVSPTLQVGGHGASPSNMPHVSSGMAVRRLTPRECERLQGFPDGYTAIPWKGKPAAQCPDGPRYKAIGNSMAVPVMRWIGIRIEAVESLLQGHAI